MRTMRDICPACQKEKMLFKGKTCSACYQIAKRAIEVTSHKSPFIAQREKYADKIIPYAASPTGNVYIGLAKQPLMKNDTGIGFKGILLQNEDRSHVQCSGCGKWMRQITAAHVKSCLGLANTRDYKSKFGLNLRQGLISDAASLVRTKYALKSLNLANLTNRAKGNRLQRHTMQYYNKHGTCPEQLRERLFQFILDNRELPAAGNRGRGLYNLLRRRYGNWNKALLAHGLPIFDTLGNRKLYVFPDGTKYEWSLQSGYDRDALFSTIVEKCPAVRGFITCPLAA